MFKEIKVQTLACKGATPYPVFETLSYSTLLMFLKSVLLFSTLIPYMQPFNVVFNVELVYSTLSAGQQ